MNNNEKNIFNELLEKGKQTGTMSAREIYSVIDEADIDIDKLNEFLDQNNIKIEDDFVVEEDLNKALEIPDDNGEDYTKDLSIKIFDNGDNAEIVTSDIDKPGEYMIYVEYGVRVGNTTETKKSVEVPYVKHGFQAVKEFNYFIEDLINE